MESHFVVTRCKGFTNLLVRGVNVSAPFGGLRAVPPYLTPLLHLLASHNGYTFQSHARSIYTVRGKAQLPR